MFTVGQTYLIDENLEGQYAQEFFGQYLFIVGSSAVAISRGEERRVKVKEPTELPVAPLKNQPGKGNPETLPEDV